MPLISGGGSFNGGTVAGAVSIVSPSTTAPALEINAPDGSGVALIQAHGDGGVDAFFVSGDGNVSFQSGSGTIGLNVMNETATNLLNYRSGVGLGIYVGSAAVHQLLNSSLGFYGAAPVAQPTGVAVTAAAIHAALVSLGLITA
jgi:hypothetical protein